MFNPENEVPSLELCKKLKGLGYPQGGGGWYWDISGNLIYFLPGVIKQENNRIYLSTTPTVRIDYTNNVIKALTIPEMVEYFNEDITISKDFKTGYLCEYENKKKQITASFEEDKLADSVAKMLIWSRKMGIVDF